MGFLDFVNSEGTIQDIDFTRRAMKDIRHVTGSEDFLTGDAEIIFQHLLSEMNTIPFRDYLKRYIYERAEMTEPFREIPDVVFKKIIIDSFHESQAPLSFTAAKRKKSAIINSWFETDSVKRSTIMAIGFGLRMPLEDVTEFLTKVIREEGFIYSDPEETVYAYCYAHSLPYQKARRYLQEYTQAESKDQEWTEAERSLYEAQLHSKDLIIPDELSLRGYLSFLKREDIAAIYEKKARETFAMLLDRVKEYIARYFMEDHSVTGREITAGDITVADVEKVLYCGVPVTREGNLKNMRRSKLADKFFRHRLTRQRINTILHGKTRVERFDLITLMFFITDRRHREDTPEERCAAFFDETNQILETCNMMPLYPANPYEAFILMCLLTDYPAAVFSDIWEMSYLTEDAYYG